MKFPLSFAALCLLIFSFPLTIAAQNKNTIKNLETEGEEYFRSEEYGQALPVYLQLDSLRPDNAMTSARIGICFLHSEFKHKALPYLEEAIQSGYKKDHIEYYLGHAYHLHHDFDKAISYFQKSKSQQSSKSPEDQSRLKRIDRYIEMCNNGKVLVQSPVQVTIENLGTLVNSPYPDYAPVISADETVLLFTSRRPASTGGKKDESGQYYEDIYMSVKEDGKWTEAKNLGSPVNTTGHDASIGLSPDGQELLLYRHEGGGDIFYSTLSGAVWMAPIKFPAAVNSSESWEPSASISADEKIVFFSSDRPGGFGGRDIYLIRKTANDQWSAPLNLGPTINTMYDEDAPFIHADGTTLYFSSKGHNSMGGFDIFQVTYNPADNSVTQPKNVGYPVNTADDEIFFVWSPDGTRGYFSSVRSSNVLGEKDLYMLTRPRTEVSLIVVKGKVLSKSGQKPIGATVTVTNNESGEVVGVYNSNTVSGKYTVMLPPGKKYALHIEAKDHLPYSDHIFIPGAKEFAELTKDIFLEPYEKGSITVLSNVFFEAHSNALKSESSLELDKFIQVLKEHPSIQIEIAGHSDNLEKDNLPLTQSQSQAVVNYLVAKGIDPNRICAVGYGDKFNIASNNTAEGRKQNNRLEMVVLGSQTGTPVAKDCKGFYYSKEDPIAQNILLNSNTEIKESDVKSLPHIQFEFNSFAMETSYKHYLDYWGKYLLKNKKVKVEIGGHTDAIGSGVYNKVLAEKRVNSVKEYLKTTGVNPARLVTKSYGKTKPIASNETEEGRKKNRRVEITILR